VPSHRAPSWTLANDPRSLIKRRQYNPLRYQSPHSKQERCGISDGPAVVLFVLFLLFVFLVIIIIVIVVIVVIIVVLLLLLRPSLTCPNTLGLRNHTTASRWQSVLRLSSRSISQFRTRWNMRYVEAALLFLGLRASDCFLKFLRR